MHYDNILNFKFEVAPLEISITSTSKVDVSRRKRCRNNESESSSASGTVLVWYLPGKCFQSIMIEVKQSHTERSWWPQSD